MRSGRRHVSTAPKPVCPGNARARPSRSWARSTRDSAAKTGTSSAARNTFSARDTLSFRVLSRRTTVRRPHAVATTIGSRCERVETMRYKLMSASLSQQRRAAQAAAATDRNCEVSPKKRQILNQIHDVIGSQLPSSAQHVASSACGGNHASTVGGGVNSSRIQSFGCDHSIHGLSRIMIAAETRAAGRDLPTAESHWQRWTMDMQIIVTDPTCSGPRGAPWIPNSTPSSWPHRGSTPPIRRSMRSQSVAGPRRSVSYSPNCWVRHSWRRSRPMGGRGPDDRRQAHRARV